MQTDAGMAADKYSPRFGRCCPRPNQRHDEGDAASRIATIGDRREARQAGTRLAVAASICAAATGFKSASWATAPAKALSPF